jgi:hypothetical protein
VGSFARPAALDRRSRSARVCSVSLTPAPVVVLAQRDLAYQHSAPKPAPPQRRVAIVCDYNLTFPGSSRSQFDSTRIVVRLADGDTSEWLFGLTTGYTTGPIV